MNYTDELYRQLKYLLEKDRAITLVNKFKGVSFSVIGKVTEISKKQDWVKVTNHPAQHLSLLPSSIVELYSDLFPRPMEARVRSVDIQERIVVLDHLDYVFEERRNRKQHRVQPDKPITASVFSKQSKRYVTSIKNLSLHGLSLLIGDADGFNDEFEVEDSVRIEFSLLIEGKPVVQPISFMTKIIYINPLKEQKSIQVGVKTWPDGQELDLIRQYIFDRQTEIVRYFSKKYDAGEQGGE